MIEIREIYLDNCATTRVSETAARTAVRMMTEEYGNPSSLHRKGLDAQRALDAARMQLARVLGAGPQQLLFTSGATESNNLALFGVAGAYRHGGRKIVTTAVEHASVLAAVDQLGREGYEMVLLRPDEAGSYSADAIAAAVDEDTLLVSLMLVNNEVGMILPVEEAVRKIRRKNPRTLIHCDAVQAFCKRPIDLRRLDVDLMSISGHKIHAPKGVGALYHKKGIRLRPLLYGGAQEGALRPGTENIALCCAFGAAAEELEAQREALYRRYEQLGAFLQEQLQKIEGICINSPKDHAPNIMNISVVGYRSETMLHFLEQRGIFVSSGSACSKGAKSHVLQAMGLSAPRIDSALRISFSKETTEEDLVELVKAIREGQNQLIRSR